MRPYYNAALGAALLAAIGLPSTPAAANHYSKLCLCSQWTFVLIMGRDGNFRQRTQCLKRQCFTIPSAIDWKSQILGPPPSLNPTINPLIHK